MLNPTLRKKRILVVDDEKDILSLLDKRLSRAGYIVRSKPDGRELTQTIREFIPDLIILDVVLPDMDGLEIKDQLNKDASTAGIPVIFLSAKDTVQDKITGLHLGADDYVTKPFDSTELLARIEAVTARRDFYEEMAMTDGLTGLRNINFFKKQMGIFFNIAKRYDKVFSLAMIDVDRLKEINDKYGHMAGDFILIKFSEIAKKTFRTADIVARYGGDEFAVIMPETGYEHAEEAVSRLKGAIIGTGFSYESGSGKAVELTFSISAGVISYDKSFVDESRMFEAADKSLYDDKNHKSR